jgi:ankyrin repeat protein
MQSITQDDCEESSFDFHFDFHWQRLRPMHIAANFGLTDLAALLSQRGHEQAPVMESDETPLSLAMANRLMEMVSLLLS